MFVRITSDPTPRPNSLHELGILGFIGKTQR
jgi:hypothetical protein